MELAARGLTNREIAGALQISAATVHAHLSAAYAALEVTNRTEATAMLLSWQGRGEPPGPPTPGDLPEPTLVIAHYGPLPGPPSVPAAPGTACEPAHARGET
jgi:hypothetical protein